MYVARPFNPTDDEYQQVVDLNNAANPTGRQESAAMMKEHDAEWETGYLHQRYVIEADNGMIVATGVAQENYWAYRPGEIHFMLDVHPAFAEQEIVEVFYDYLIAQMQARVPATERLVINLREAHFARIRFIKSKGFVLTERNAQSALRVQSFDLSPSTGREEAALADGIRIYTLAQAKELDPAWKMKLYQLRCALNLDVPGAKMEITLEQFERIFLADPALDPEAWWIAVDRTTLVSQAGSVSPQETKIQKTKIQKTEVGYKVKYNKKVNDETSKILGIGEFVGYSNLWINDETRKRLDTGMTGVIRGHRFRGIATLLKLKAIAYAQRHNSERIVTTNEENNPMLDLNVKLGFEPIPGWNRYEKIFQAEKEQS